MTKRKKTAGYHAPRELYVNRIAAIMAIYGFEEQKPFVKELEPFGVDYNQFNNIARGASDLSLQVALAINKRFQISIDFLYLGTGNALSLEIRERLMRWQNKTGRKIFLF